MPSVCLAIICKNEAALIRTALASVKPFIDRWCVVDTGSTDGTQAIVREEMNGIPGELHERPWVNWSHNRTEAITLAKASGCDFIFLLDADEKVIAPEDFTLELDPTKAYWVEIKYGVFSYTRPNILSAKYDWHYVGVTHEYLTAAPDELPRILLPLVLETNLARADKTPEKCLEDVRLLEQGVKDEPENSRYWFYLAQSYKDSLQPEKAIEVYGKRALMGGYPEEVYISLLRVAQLSEGRRAFAEVCHAYKAAQEYRPQRAGETLRNLARYCLWWADGTVCPADRLFVDRSCYKSAKLKVLAIVPTRNQRPEMLREALLSLITQSRPADEIVVADSDAPLHLRLNETIAKSDCDAFLVLGDDDLLEREFIAKAADLMEQSGADIVHTQYRHFGEEDCVAGSEQHISVTSLFKKSIWAKAGGYAAVPYFDWDFAWRCIEKGAKTAYIPEPLWKYRIHPGQAGQQESAEEKDRNQMIVVGRHS